MSRASEHCGNKLEMSKGRFGYGFGLRLSKG